MNFLRLLPVILSFLLLAAHFSRADLLPFVVISLVAPSLLFIKKKWIPRIMQILLIAGAFEWIRAMLGYIEIRKAIGDDWIRLAIILCTVALLTAASGLVFQSKPLKRLYRIGNGDSRR